MKGPPKATLARRAKSYSDFYEVAIGFLNKEAKSEKSRDDFEPLEKSLDNTLSETTFERLEDDLLDASQEEYQYVTSTGLMRDTG